MIIMIEDGMDDFNCGLEKSLKFFLQNQKNGLLSLNYEDSLDKMRFVYNIRFLKAHRPLDQLNAILITATIASSPTKVMAFMVLPSSGSF